MTDDQLLTMLSWDSVRSRFWKRVDKNAPGGCWNYTSFRTFRGKVRPNEFTVHRCEMTPRRVAWAMQHGELPARDVLATCGNPLCVNHDHLVLEHVPTPEERLEARRENDRRRRAKKRGGYKYATDEEREAARLAQMREYNAAYRARKRAERASEPKPVKEKTAKAEKPPKPVAPPREKIVKKPVCKAKTDIGKVSWLARLVGFRLSALGGGFYRVERGAAM